MVIGLCVAAPVSAQSELVIVKDTAAKEYHRPGCPIVRDGKDVLAMTRAEAESRGFKSHRDCDPAVQAPAAQSGAAPSTPKPPPETVYLDRSTKYYHRKTCPKLGTHVEAVTVTAVGKRWACPTCKPPVPKRSTDPLVPRWRG
jgi:hypothetical protein